MRELIIDSIRVGLRHYRRVVVLKEKEADRYLTIWVGADVADAIALRLQDVQVPRPQSHDLMLTLIQDMGGSVTSVEVTAYWFAPLRSTPCTRMSPSCWAT